MLLQAHFSHPFQRPSQHLQASLRAALASHRPAALKILFDHYGARSFALALSGLSQRAMADALSMLPATDRAHTHKYLPKSARHSVSTLPAQHPNGRIAVLLPPRQTSTAAIPHAAAARI